MADLLIRFRPPPSLSEAEKRAWIEQRARARKAGLARRASGRDDLLLHVRVPERERATEEHLAQYLLMNAAVAASRSIPAGGLPT